MEIWDGEGCSLETSDSYEIFNFKGFTMKDINLCVCVCVD